MILLHLMMGLLAFAASEHAPIILVHTTATTYANLWFAEHINNMKIFSIELNSSMVKSHLLYSIQSITQRDFHLVGFFQAGTLVKELLQSNQSYRVKSLVIVERTPLPPFEKLLFNNKPKFYTGINLLTPLFFVERHVLTIDCTGSVAECLMKYKSKIIFIYRGCK